MTYEFRQDIIVPGVVKAGGVENNGSQWSGTTFIQNKDPDLTDDSWKYEVLDNDYHLKVIETAKYNNSTSALPVKNTIIEMPDPIIVHGRELIIEDSGGNAAFAPITVQFTNKFTGVFDNDGKQIPEIIPVYTMNKNHEKIKITADGSEDTGNAWRVEQAITPSIGVYQGVDKRQSYEFDLDGSAAPGGGWYIHDDGQSQFYFLSVIGSANGGAVLRLTLPHPAEISGRQLWFYTSTTGNAVASQWRISQRDRTYDENNNGTTLLYDVALLNDPQHIIGIFSLGDRYAVNSYHTSPATNIVYDPLP